LVHIPSPLPSLHFEILEFWFVFSLLLFVPPTLESSIITGPLENKIHLVFPLSFFLLIFQLQSDYFHSFFCRNFLPLTQHPSTVNDTNRWPLFFNLPEVFSSWLHEWKHLQLSFEMETPFMVSSLNSLHSKVQMG
jgi:hypothetical protein